MGYVPRSMRRQVIQTQQVSKANSMPQVVLWPLQASGLSLECPNQEAKSLGLLQLERERERERERQIFGSKSCKTRIKKEPQKTLSYPLKHLSTYHIHVSRFQILKTHHMNRWIDM